MRNRSFLGVALALAVGGCGGMSYEGDVSPPTAHIDVYFDADAIEQDFTTMGTLALGPGASIASLESELASAGMKRGADAIVIDGMTPADARSVASNRAEGNGRPRYVPDLTTGGVRNIGGAEHHERLTMPSSVSARLLRYDR